MGMRGHIPVTRLVPQAAGSQERSRVTQSLQMVGIQRLEHALRSAQRALWVLAAAMATAHGGESAPHAAVEKGARKQVERLLQAGADAKPRADAAAGGNAAVVKLLERAHQ